MTFEPQAKQPSDDRPALQNALGQINGITITETDAKKPSPEITDFMRDINRINDENKRTRPKWTEVERRRREALKLKTAAEIEEAENNAA